MKQSRAAAMMLLLLAGAGILCAVERGAPLEQSKQELQELRKERKMTENSGSAEGLKVEMPALSTPTSSGPTFSPLTNEAQRSKERESQPGANKNWLLDGMARLERNTHDKSRWSERFEDETANVSEEGKFVDTSDPAYLLKAYEKSKEPGQLGAEPHKSTGKSSNTAEEKNDVFGPFLQDWLANSPIKNQIMEGLGRHSDATGLIGQNLATELGGRAAEILQSHEAPSGGRSALAVPAATKANPYLVELSPLPDAIQAAQLVKPEHVAIPATVAPVMPVVLPAPAQAETESLAPVKKIVPPALSDDNKYFPQLKRF